MKKINSKKQIVQNTWNRRNPERMYQLIRKGHSDLLWVPHTWHVIFQSRVLRFEEQKYCLKLSYWWNILDSRILRQCQRNGRETNAEAKYTENRFFVEWFFFHLFWHIFQVPSKKHKKYRKLNVSIEKKANNQQKFILLQIRIATFCQWARLHFTIVGM